VSLPTKIFGLGQRKTEGGKKEKKGTERKATQVLRNYSKTIINIFTTISSYVL